jgi:hypothetical protein
MRIRRFGGMVKRKRNQKHIYGNKQQPSEGALSFFLWLLFGKQENKEEKENDACLLLDLFFFAGRKKTAKAPLYDRYITGKENDEKTKWI